MICAEVPPIPARAAETGEAGPGTSRPLGFNRREIQTLLFRAAQVDVEFGGLTFNGTITLSDPGTSDTGPGPNSTDPFEGEMGADSDSVGWVETDERERVLDWKAGTITASVFSTFTGSGSIEEPVWETYYVIPPNPPDPGVTGRQLATPLADSGAVVLTFFLMFRASWHRESADALVSTVTGGERLFWPVVEVIATYGGFGTQATWGTDPHGLPNPASPMSLTILGRTAEIAGGYSYAPEAATNFLSATGSPTAPAIEITPSAFLTYGGRWDGSTGAQESTWLGRKT